MLMKQDIFGRAQYRTHLGLEFTDIGGVKVRCFQLVDNLDNRSIASVVFHDTVEVDRMHAPERATDVAEWIPTIPLA